MKFIKTYTYDKKGVCFNEEDSEVIEVESIEQLLKMVNEEEGQWGIVITKKDNEISEFEKEKYNGIDYIIEIYNGFRE